MGNANRPILVGVGQCLDRPATLSDALSPLGMMAKTAQLAANDAGLSKNGLSQVDNLVVVNSVGKPFVDNPPAALARRLGLVNCEQRLTVTGGNTPQMLVNIYADAIAKGEASFVLLSGAEALDTLRKAERAGQDLGWTENGYGPPTLQSMEAEGTNETEKAHGMMAPIVTYPLFENALRHHYGRSFEEHQRSLGELFAPYTDIAAENPYAWFPTRRSAWEISQVSSANRYIGFPYTKYLNAVMQVNQSASVLMTSEGKARDLGIDPARWIYLRGCSDVNDIWNVSERTDFHSSPALRAGVGQALGMAKVTIDEIDCFDLYSCFPSAVQIARDALGLAQGDPRPLTVTGGLPYFGGAGNNYAMHAVATMVQRLRDAPGSVGMITANGWYVTKHSIGIYSAQRPSAVFERPDPSILQRKIDALEHPALDPEPSGEGTVETYTVLFGRDGKPERGLVIGMLRNGCRFVAHTASTPHVLEAMLREDPIGKSGIVTPRGKTNLFEFTP